MKIRNFLFLALVVVAFVGAAQVPACDDRDRDGIINSEDNCAFTYNPLQRDEDGDSNGDACDTDTPMHDYFFDQCYYSTLTPNGVGETYTDLPTTILAQDTGDVEGVIRLPAQVISQDLAGVGRHNGEYVWLMLDNTNLFDFWAVLLEGGSVAADGDNVVQSIEGAYNLLYCPNCFGGDYTDDYTNWTGKSMGVWTAERTDPANCGLTDDDTADDDTVDDDAVDDDEVDDDEVDDDEAPADDDDDDDSGCGC